MSSCQSISATEADAPEGLGRVSVRPNAAEAAPRDAGRVRLEAAGLTLSWDGEAVCRDVSFDVHEGELLCLVGKSGSGKTTIFHALAGLTVPDAGCVFLDGEDVTGRPGKVSYMLQKDMLFDISTPSSITSACPSASLGRRSERPEARPSPTCPSSAFKAWKRTIHPSFREACASVRRFCAPT